MAKTIWRLGSGLSESLFPINRSLADWGTYSQLFVGSSSPNAGRYAATIDETISDKWALFTGTSQPANWNSGIIIDLSLEVLLDDVLVLLKADQLLEEESGIWMLKTYLRGTTTEVIPAKEAKQPGGTALTNPNTQLLAGYQEEA